MCQGTYPMVANGSSRDRKQGFRAPYEGVLTERAIMVRRRCTTRVGNVKQQRDSPR